MPENNAIIVARPTILINDQAHIELTEGLIKLQIKENISGLYRCEATFGNWGTVNKQADYLYFDFETLNFGVPFKVAIGLDPIFEGRITALEAHFPESAAPEISILAEDRLQDLRMTRRTRTFPSGIPTGQTITDATLFQQIASEHGLEAQVNVSGPNYPILAQLNQSDLAFLRERARSINAEIWVTGKTLHASSRSSRNAVTLNMHYQRELRSFSVLADLAEQRTSVTVSGWDRATKTALSSEVTEETIVAELRGKRGGATILNTTFGERKEALAHTTPVSSTEAEAIANAYFKTAARRFIVGHGIANPDARLRVGNLVNLSDLGTLFSGTYYLSEVQHLFDDSQGIRTEFTAERPSLEA